MATSESKGELVIPITVVQSLLLLRRLFVQKITHVEHRRVTVNLMTCASLEQHVEKKTVLLLKPVQIVMIFFQKLIVVSTWDLQFLYTNTAEIPFKLFLKWTNTYNLSSICGF